MLSCRHFNAGYANAATYGAGSQFDARIQSVMFNESDVVNVRVQKGTVSVVQVGNDETIKDVGLGDRQRGKCLGIIACFSVQWLKITQIQTSLL